MNRFERSTHPALYIVIFLTTVGVFLADLFTPLGVAVWIVYLVPLVLTFFVWQPRLPILLGAGVTALVIIGFFGSSPGVTLYVAIANRTMGVVTIWAMALAAYQSVRNKLAVRRQEWLQSGQTQLSQKMSGEQTVPQLADNVLRFLAEYCGAHAGAMFAGDPTGLNRVATYAVPAGAAVPEAVAPGVGLLGQAAKDQRVFLVEGVPPGYLVVGSGLGQGAPARLLIAPIIVDGAVNGVVEFAFLHEVYEADQELLRRVSESVAVAIRSSQFRARLQELLDETQRQAEELQAQSEELRVSNEELEEQGQALKESQARLEQQQAELEQTNAHLEEQAKILEQQRDDLRRAQEELKIRARELEQASRYKSEFLANMSHELRTPLNSSLILSNLLAMNREGNLTPEQIRYAQTIQTAGNDLLGLINDILDLSKIEAGRVEVRPEQVFLPRLADELRRLFEPVAAQKGLAFGVRVAEGTSEPITTDGQRLEQVLKNLLSNALKFTEKGSVFLDISASAGGTVAFAVTDTGIGIAEHQREVIFEAFRQADGTTNRRYGGTGLGLSISRELVRLLGGTLSVESRVGQGSTFTVTLPRTYDPALVQPAVASPRSRATIAADLPVPQAPAVRAQPPVRAAAAADPGAPPQVHVQDDRGRLTGQSRVILVIEDDATFARILYDLAQEAGFQCIIATTADEGLLAAREFMPSAVVLDVGLPDHSGLSVLDRLKHDGRTRHIPVHVVSGADHVRTAMDMGAVGYMMKPVKREQLADAFTQLQDRLTHQIRRVLVVEDDAVQRESLCALLATREVETHGAGSMEECLARLKAGTYDCMVLDLTLPDASGFALLDRLGGDESYPFPPVIIYTGRDLSSDEEQRLRKYSASIIIKGAKSPERLLDEVTLFLHQVVSDLSAEQQKMLQRARSRDAALEGRRVLIVEDDVRNVFAVTSILEPHGVRISIARNGREALEALERALAPGGEPVDLVLMDIMMPEMDGITATREIRKRPEWKKLPIIALTAKAMRDDQEQCLSAGANDYMAKPLDVDKLLSLVRVWMPR